MTHLEAVELVDTLIGWRDVRIECDDWGDFIVTAVNPQSHRRMVFHPTTGYFEDDAPNR